MQQEQQAQENGSLILNCATRSDICRRVRLTNARLFIADQNHFNLLIVLFVVWLGYKLKTLKSYQLGRVVIDTNNRPSFWNIIIKSCAIFNVFRNCFTFWYKMKANTKYFYVDLFSQNKIYFR